MKENRINISKYLVNFSTHLLFIYSNVRKITVELFVVHNEKWLATCWAEKQMCADSQLLIWAPQRAVASCRLPLSGSWQGNMHICSLAALEKFQLDSNFPAVFTEEESALRRWQGWQPTGTCTITPFSPDTMTERWLKYCRDVT